MTFMLIMAMAPVWLCAQNNVFRLDGKLGNQPFAGKAYLMFDTKTDSASIVDGTFHFKNTLKKPTKATLMVKYKVNGLKGKQPLRISLYLEPTIITVMSPDSLRNAIVKGGELNAESGKFKTLMGSVTTINDEIDVLWERASPEERKQAKTLAKIDSLQGILTAEQNKIYSTYVGKHPDALYSIYILRSIQNPDTDDKIAENLFNQLSKRVKNSTLGVEYAAELAQVKKTVVGARAPNFAMADTSGKSVDLSKFKGKYLLIDFWASWCGPCKAENPNVVKNYALYHDKGFEILGVSLDYTNSRAAWINAIAKDQLTWTQVSDLKGWYNASAVMYSVRAIPTNFLIGPDGKIIAKSLRGEDLGATLAKLLNK